MRKFLVSIVTISPKLFVKDSNYENNLILYTETLKKINEDGSGNAVYSYFLTQ